MGDHHGADDDDDVHEDVDDDDDDVVHDDDAAIAVVDRPTQLIIGIFVELAVATPVERRTFVSVVPTARKSKLGPISFQNIRNMCIQMDKMHLTGQKSGKRPSKTLFFPASPTI